MSPKTNKEGKQCTICSRFFRKNSLRRHIQSVHKLNTFSIPNNYDKESEPTLEIHSPVHERIGQTMPGFQFVSCDASFIEDINLNSHVAEANMIKSLNTKTIELNPNINPNPEIKTEVPESDDLALNCDEQTPDSDDQTIERRKPFQCNICNTSFATSG